LQLPAAEAPAGNNLGHYAIRLSDIATSCCVIECHFRIPPEKPGKLQFQRSTVPELHPGFHPE
jgi:hypothetical protein